MTDYSITISSFSPFEGAPGETIIMEVPDGISGVTAGTLMFMGGFFRKDGKTFSTAVGSILDHERYTQFSLTVPPEASEPGEYEFELMLAGNGKVSRNKYTLISDFTFTVEAGEGRLRPRIMQAIPSEITEEDLPSTIIRLNGANLDNIDRNTMRLIPGNSKIRVMNGTDQFILVRLNSSSSLTSGNYTFNAHTVDGDVAVSTARLMVTK